MRAWLVGGWGLPRCVAAAALLWALGGALWAQPAPPAPPTHRAVFIGFRVASAGRCDLQGFGDIPFRDSQTGTTSHQQECAGGTVRATLSVTGAPAVIKGRKTGSFFYSDDPLPVIATLTLDIAYAVPGPSVSWIGVPFIDTTEYALTPRGTCPDRLSGSGASTRRDLSINCLRSSEQTVYRLTGSTDDLLRLEVYANHCCYVPPSGATPANPRIGMNVDAMYRIEEVPADLALDHIEVVQVVQDRSNSIPLIQGKPTVARVFPKVVQVPGGPAQQNRVTAELRGFYRGVELPLSPLQPFNAPITAVVTPQRDNANHSLNFRIPHIWTQSDGLRLVAEVKANLPAPDETPADNRGEVTVTFRPSPSLSVAWMPICIRSTIPGNPAFCPNLASLARHGLYAEKVFPIAPANFNYTQLLIPQRTYGGLFGNAQFDSYLRRFYDLFASGYDQLAAWVINLLPGFKITGSSDPIWFTADPGKGRVSWQTDWIAVDPLYPARTLAHEIAHNLGRRHTHRADSCGAVDAGSDWPSSFATSNIREPGFDPVRRVIKPSTLFDLMTYCAPRVDNTWISPFTYQKLMESGLKPSAEPSRRLAEGDWIVIGGSARRDGSGGTLTPGIRVQGAGETPPPPTAPTHFIRFFGDAGMLGEQPIALTFRDHQDQDVIFEEEYFSVKTPLPSGTTRIALFAGDAQLASLSPGPATPQVTITSPQNGDVWDGGARTVAWTATDADNDPLTYSVLYSSDSGVNWLPMELDLAEPQFTFDASQIAGGKAVMFRVVVTDGIHTGAAEIGPIEVVQVPKIEIAVERLDLRKAVLLGFHDATLNIVNSGTGPLTVTSIVPSTEEFSILATTPITISAGQTFPLDVRFEPARIGLREARLKIDSTDPARPSVEIVLAGTGLTTPETDLEFLTSEIDFGDVNVGAAVTRPVTILNHGPATSVLNPPALGIGAFSVPGQIGIPAGETRAVNVTFRPTAAGRFAATAVFTTDDPARPTVRIPVAGRGIIPDLPDKVCTYKLGAAAISAGSAAASHSVDVETQEGCPWSASTIFTNFIRFGENPGGTGAGRLTFNLAANSNQSSIATYLIVAGQQLTVVQAGTAARFSDSFARADAEACAVGRADLAFGGTGNHYYVPLFAAPHPSIAGRALRHGGQDYGGVQFSASPNPCAGGAANRGENLGDSLSVQMAVRVPSDASNRVTQAGPYFRSRAAALGETILGTSSAGFWVQLDSTGAVKVKNLANDAVIAQSERVQGFDPSIWHVLEIGATSTILFVTLDGRQVTFANGQPIAPLPAIAANNQGGTGVAFGSEGNRNQIGGQQVKDVIVSAYGSPGSLR